MVKVNLRKKTERALGVLSGALETLSKVNEQAQSRKAKNLDKINRIESENSDLSSLIAENNIVSNNIQKLLGK